MRRAALALVLVLAASCAPSSGADRSAAPSVRATPDPTHSGETLGCLRTFLVLPAARCLDH